MADRFWVGGTGDWDAADTTHWSASSGGAGGQSVPTSSDTVTFDSNSGATATVTITATANASSITINKSDLILLHNAGSTVTGTVTLTTGTLNTNGQTCSWAGFSSSNANARTITLGASSITITGGGTPAWTTGTITNLTWNAGTSTIIFSASSPTFSPGSLTYSTVSFTGAATPVLNSALTCTNFTRTGTAVKTSVMSLGGDITCSGTVTCNGNSAINRVLVQSNTVGTARTITAATVTVTNSDFQDITGAGAGSWNLSAITGNSGDCGGNSGITFTTAATQTYTGGTDNWSEITKWTSRVPLPQDNVLMSGVTGGTITGDMPRSGKSIDWTGAAGTPAWTLSTGTSIFGSLTLISGMGNVAGNQTINFAGRGTHTITSGGKNYGSSPVGLVAFGGSYTLLDAFQTNAAFTLSNGTIDTSGFNLTILSFSSNVTTTRALTLGSSTVTMNNSPTVWTVNYTGLTVSAADSTLSFSSTNANAVTFNGGSQTWGTLNRTTPGASRGAFTIQGSNSFSALNVTNSLGATTLNITAGTTQTIRSAAGWGVNGTSGNLVTLTSPTAATHTIACSSGNISCNYLDISYSIGNGGAGFYAGMNSTNSGNNTGWLFVTGGPPFAASGGTITTDGAYTVHSFTSTGTFTPNGTKNVEVLVVGGGGGGGSTSNASGVGGGGGAGGLVHKAIHEVTAQAYAVTVGAGGTGKVYTAGAVGAGGDGNDSVFDGITAESGGGGGSSGAEPNGRAGGSGGGAGTESGATGGVENQGDSGGGTGFGSNGGASNAVGDNVGGGGGGGAGAVGAAGSTPAYTGGSGGVGKEYTISGAATYYAGGGGGASYDVPGGVGGNGGGGAGGNNGAGTAATANTGGGGGGGSVASGGNGGSGIVIIRYLNTITGGNLTQYSEQEVLNYLNGSGEHQYTEQEIANDYNNSSEHSLTLQEVLNTQAGRKPHSMSEQEALFANLSSSLGLTGSPTQYSVQELLNLAKANGISLATVLG